MRMKINLVKWLKEYYFFVNFHEQLIPVVLFYGDLIKIFKNGMYVQYHDVTKWI